MLHNVPGARARSRAGPHGRWEFPLGIGPCWPLQLVLQKIRPRIKNVLSCFKIQHSQKRSPHAHRNRVRHCSWSHYVQGHIYGHKRGHCMCIHRAVLWLPTQQNISVKFPQCSLALLIKYSSTTVQITRLGNKERHTC